MGVKMSGIFGLKGLIKGNVLAYLKAISKGASHEKALEHVLKSRYIISKRNRRTVMDMFQKRKLQKKVIDKSQLYKPQNNTPSCDNADHNSDDWVELNLLVECISKFEIGYIPSDFMLEYVSFWNELISDD